MITRRALLAAAGGALLPGGAPMGFQNPITGGQGALIRPAIKSPNYVPGVSGWSINRDGSAEFNNVTVRGTIVASTFQGTDFQIDSNGAFFYSAAPAAGDLIATVTRSAGTDGHTNQYLAGFTSYSPPAGGFVQANGGVLTLGVMAASVADTTHASNFAGGTNGQAQFTSGFAAGTPAAVETVWTPGTNASASGHSTTPRVTVLSAAIGPAADVWMSGSAIKTTAGGVNYTWQSVANAGITLGTGWADNLVAGGAQGFQVRLDAEDNLVLTGTLHTTSNTPAATIFTLVAPYVPATLQRDVQVLSRVGGVNTTNILSISAATGNVSLVANLTATNTDLYINAVVPLGNIL